MIDLARSFGVALALLPFAAHGQDDSHFLSMRPAALLVLAQAEQLEHTIAPPAAEVVPAHAAGDLATERTVASSVVELQPVGPGQAAALGSAPAVPVMIPETGLEAVEPSRQSSMVFTSPEVRKAQAEVELAEAEHNKVRQEVARDVTLTYQGYVRAKEDEVRASSGAADDNITNREAAERTRSAAELEANLRYLLGIGVPLEKPGAAGFAEMPDRLEDMIVAALAGNADVKQTAARVNLARLNLESVQQRVSLNVSTSASRVAKLEERVQQMQGKVDLGITPDDGSLIELRALVDEAKQAAHGFGGGGFGGGSGGGTFGGGGFGGPGSFGNAPKDQAMGASRDEYNVGIQTGGRRTAATPPVSRMIPIANSRPTRPDVSKVMQEKLDQEFSGAFASEGVRTLREVLDTISSNFGDLNFVLDIEVDSDEKLTVKMENLSLKNMLLALTDQIGDLCFVIRDYGILVTTMNRAETINAPTIPADLLLRDR